MERQKNMLNVYLEQIGISGGVTGTIINGLVAVTMYLCWSRLIRLAPQMSVSMVRNTMTSFRFDLAEERFERLEDRMTKATVLALNLSFMAMAMWLFLSVIHLS